LNSKLNRNPTLFEVTCCGICGTDGHIHEGEFIAKFPLIPGHEAIGKVVEMGKNVKGFDIGDRCVADVGISVRNRSLSCILSPTSHCLDSVVLVSIAVVVMSFFVRTLVPRVSPWMVVLRNISNSKSIILQFLYSPMFTPM
jgi:threonine dehydrogenase-like Zn-dependent dehydrogenase